MCKITTQKKLKEIEELVEADNHNGKHLCKKIKNKLKRAGIRAQDFKDQLKKLKNNEVVA